MRILFYIIYEHLNDVYCEADLFRCNDELQIDSCHHGYLTFQIIPLDLPCSPRLRLTFSTFLFLPLQDHFLVHRWAKLLCNLFIQLYLFATTPIWFHLHLSSVVISRKDIKEIWLFLSFVSRSLPLQDVHRNQ